MSFLLISTLLVFYHRSEQRIFDEIEKQTAELTKAIQIGVEEVTASGNTDEARLSNYLKQLNAKGIKEISIISNEDQIIASTIPSRIGEPITRKKKELIIKAELGEPVSDEGRTFNIIFPVISGGTEYAYIHHGYIHLKINKDDFSELLRAATLEKIVVTVLVFTIGIILTFIFSRHYTRPIHDIVNAALKVAQGDLTQNLPIRSSDEIGQLSESFNHMVNKLRENKKIEERLREVEHVTAIGQLSRNMAHEIRNPLNFINLSIDYINSKYVPEDEKERERFYNLINGIKMEIQRLNTLVNEFLNYSKPIKLNRKNVRFKEIIDDLLSLIIAKADAEKVNILYEIKTDCELSVDPDLIKSCILNIFTNAFSAMQNIDRQRLLTIRAELILNEFILSITDNGEGVEAEKLPKIFEPFFSSKKDGLGLGLPFTKRVIEEHGGRVEFISKKNEGTEVKIILPYKNQNNR
ncbi:MAG: HAMP domain-containing histidine kinase [Thermodesulfovibrionales bacterium]|nr:HAMP domain-containing histidine kinase [Thermodesulfovibrionales bacterium]